MLEGNSRILVGYKLSGRIALAIRIRSNALKCGASSKVEDKYCLKMQRTEPIYGRHRN